MNRTESLQLHPLPFQIAREPSSVPIAVVMVLYFLAMVVNAEALAAISFLRYVNYALPFCVAIIWLSTESRRMRVYPGDYVRVALLWTSFVIPLLLGGDIGLKYFVFMGFGMAIFLFPVRIPFRYLKSLFWLTCVAQVALTWSAGAEIRSLNVDSFSSGSAAVTHTLPIIFGLLLGPMLELRRFKLSALCLAMILVSGKRSVAAASLFAFLIYFLDILALKWSLSRGRPIVSNKFIFPVLMSGFAIALVMPTIYEFLSINFGYNINVLTSGRYAGQAVAYSSIFNSADTSDLLFGQGLGSADMYAQVAFRGLATLIHSDYLRVIVDFGLFPGVFFCVSYMGLVGRGPLGTYFVVFLAQLWFTENSLIAISTPILIYFCQQVVRTELADNKELKSQIQTDKPFAA